MLPQRVADELNAPHFQRAKFTSVFANQVLAFVEQSGWSAIELITDELEFLEGARPRTTTKGPSPLRGGILDGLMHKHFFTPASLHHNLKNYWFGGAGNVESKISRVLGRIAKEQETEVFTEEVLEAFRKRLIYPALDHKAVEGSLTGDWIIFVRHEGENHYLCLARHEEEHSAIHRRFYQNAKELFPYLPLRTEA